VCCLRHVQHRFKVTCGASKYSTVCYSEVEPERNSNVKKIEKTVTTSVKSGICKQDFDL
jgi:hypothetical protein